MSPPTRSDIVSAVRDGLADAADPDAAPGMRAYMKSAMPYYGVRMPVVRRIAKAVYDARRMDSRPEWEATVRSLYDDATHREERYAALALVSHRFYKPYAQDVVSLDLYEHLVRTGAWWDLVDETAHRVGDVLSTHRSRVTPAMRAWSTADDLWVRRSAIICQLGHQGDTDLDLLSAVIEPNIADRAFFIRKAIGWALREVSSVEPEWVREFVAAHPALAPLSRREALRHIGPAGGV